MKKRFFNALILGAVLLSTGAVTSCKDYDDDISNLQEQVNKLAQLESLKTDVATLQSAVTAAQGDATKALADAKAAADKADKAATADQLKALDEAVKKAQADIAALGDKADKADVKALEDLIAEYKGEMDKLSANVADQLKDALEKYALTADVNALADRVAALEAAKPGESDINIDELKKWYENLLAQAEELGIAVSTMITDVQLYGGATAQFEAGFNTDLNFLYIAEKADYKWYEDINKNAVSALDDKNATPTEGYEFKQDGAYFGSDSLLVRVSPATATLKAENVSFINSQGKSLDDIVMIEDVHKYEGLLTRASVSETGLWVVKVKPVTTKNDKGAEVLNSDAFKAATLKDKAKIVYAVAVKSAISEKDEARCVTSEYDVTAVTEDGKQANPDFTVNKESILNIHNRYLSNENGQEATGNQELVWKDETPDGKYGPQTTVIYEKGKTGEKYNAIQAESDNRQAKVVLPVELGKDITIDFTPAENDTKHGGVKGFFVVLDERNAVESKPSEIRAWRSFKYENVGYTDNDATKHPAKLFSGNVGTIKVTSAPEDAEGDVIGFRVYAVNYDGTLVDPDGRAFYVVLGKEITENKNEYEATCTNSSSVFTSGKVSAEDFFGKNYKDLGATFASVAKSSGKDADEKQLVFGMKLYKETNKGPIAIFTPSTDGTTGSWDGTTINWSDVNYVEVFFAQPGIYIDGAKYTQEFYMTKTSTSTTAGTTVIDLRKITVSATKKMPSAPAFKFKSGQSTNQWIIPTGNSFLCEQFAPNAAKPNDKVDLSKVGIINLKSVLLEQKGNAWEDLKTDANFHFEFSVAASMWKKDKYSDAASVVPSGTDFKLDLGNSAPETTVKIVDNTTSHAVSAKYVYAGISKRKLDDGVYHENQDYKADATSENVKEFVYCSWTKDFETDATNWTAEPTYAQDKDGNWYVAYTTPNNVLTWSKGEVLSLNLGKVAVTTNMTGLGTYASQFKSTDGKMLSLGELINAGYLKISDYKMTGEAGDVDPYYNITYDKANAVETTNGAAAVLTFTRKNTENSPLSHTEKLTFKVKDCFGNEIPVTLDVTVQP